MTEETFDRLQAASADFAFTSLAYADYLDLKEHSVLEESDALILLYGYNKESKLWEYHWATNDSAVLLDCIKPKTDTIVSFVPADWIDAFRERGFSFYARWQDYFISDINAVDTIEGGTLLTDAECADAAAITQACRYQSRGFSGQTEAWVRSWLNNENDDTENNAIFIDKDEDRIVGIVCTATYAHDHPKGAVVWIREAAVDPKYQGRGIGRKLIKQALNYGKRHGATRAFLAADECNTGAIALYKSIGFCEGEDEPQNDLIFIAEQNG